MQEIELKEQDKAKIWEKPKKANYAWVEHLKQLNKAIKRAKNRKANKAARTARKRQKMRFK